MSVDPRIGLELEKLNNSCEKINNLEVKLGKFFLFIDVYRRLHPFPFFLSFFVQFLLHSINLSIADELKRNYQELQEKSHHEIQLISSKIKNAIDLARPFYESRRQTSELLKQLKVDQANYEKAKTNLAAAKEMVFLAEQSVTQVNWELLILN